MDRGRAPNGIGHLMILVSLHVHHVWYSQPATEEHPITPNLPLRNGCIWQQYGEHETH